MTTACFRITGAFMTEQARSFWSEEQDPERAIRWLMDGLPGITYDQVLAVLEGRQKLTGDSVGGIVLEPDSASGLPTLSVVMRRERAAREDAEDRAADYAQMAVGATVGLASPGGLRHVPERKVARSSGKMALVDGYDWPENAVASGCKPLQVYRATDTPWLDRMSAQPAEPGEQYDEESGHELPHPSSSIDQENGWLAPDGKFYPCARTGHVQAICDLGLNPAMAEVIGWVKIADGNVFGFLGDAKQARPTEIQIKRVVDYCLTGSHELPHWAQEH